MEVFDSLFSHENIAVAVLAMTLTGSWIMFMRIIKWFVTDNRKAWEIVDRQTNVMSEMRVSMELVKDRIR